MRGSSTEFVWLALKTRSAHTFIDSGASMRVTKPIFVFKTIGKINSSEFSEFFQF